MDTLFPDLPTAVHHDEARLRAVVPPRHDAAPDDAPDDAPDGAGSGARGTRATSRPDVGRIDPARADALLEGLNPEQRVAGRPGGAVDVGLHVPFRLRADPAARGGHPRPALVVLDLRLGRLPAAAHPGGP